MAEGTLLDLSFAELKERIEQARTDAAQQVGRFNALLQKEGRPYLIDRSLFLLYDDLPDGAPGRRVVWDHPELIREVPVESDAVLLDLDTPEDYERMRARFDSPPLPPGTGGLDHS